MMARGHATFVQKQERRANGPVLMMAGRKLLPGLVSLTEDAQVATLATMLRREKIEGPRDL